MADATADIGELAQGASAVNNAALLVGLSNPVTAPLAAVAGLVAVVASLFGNSHPAGHDTFVGILANGGDVFNDDESNNQTDATTLQINAAYVQALNQVHAALKGEGYALTNPNIVIEIRDDGTPAQLHTNVQPMTAAQKAAYNLPNGLVGDADWNDRDPSQYFSLGPPSDLNGVVTAYIGWLQSNGYLTPPKAQPVSASSLITGVRSDPLAMFAVVVGGLLALKLMKVI